MKFIAFWEFCPEDIDKVIEKNREFRAEMEKVPEKYPKPLSKNYAMGGETKGFILFETNDMEQLANLALFDMPEVKYKFVPLIETAKALELYLKMKE